MNHLVASRAFDFFEPAFPSICIRSFRRHSGMVSNRLLEVLGRISFLLLLVIHINHWEGRRGAKAGALVNKLALRVLYMVGIRMHPNWTAFLHMIAGYSCTYMYNTGARIGTVTTMQYG